jgi:hypothetical protein
MNSGSPFNERQGTLPAPPGESKAMEGGSGSGSSSGADSPSGDSSGSDDDRKPSPKGPKQMIAGGTGRRGEEDAGRTRAESPPSKPSPHRAAAGGAATPARSSGQRSFSSPARSVDADEIDDDEADGTAPPPRKKRPRYTLDQLEDIAAQVRDTDQLDLEEKQRQMGIVYSKRKRLRAKLREKCIEDERDSLVVDNDRLQRENERLEGVLQRALQAVAHIEAAGGGSMGAAVSAKRKAPPPDAAALLRRAAAEHHPQMKTDPSLLLPSPVPAISAPPPPNPSLLQELLLRHQLHALTDPADRMLHDSTADRPRPASVPSFGPHGRSLLDLQLLGRERPVGRQQQQQQQPPSLNSSNLSDTMFEPSRPSSSSLSSPDLGLLSRSYGILQQRLVVHNEHRRHLNALLSTSSSSLSPPRPGAEDYPLGFGTGLESQLLSGRRPNLAGAGAAASAFDESPLEHLQRQSMLSSRAASAALAAASAAASTANSASAMLHWGNVQQQQQQQLQLRQQLLLREQQQQQQQLLLREQQQQQLLLRQQQLHDLAEGDAPPPAALGLLLGMLPAHEQLVLARMDDMSASDLLALYHHFRGSSAAASASAASPLAAQIVGHALRRRLEEADAASVAAAARHANPSSFSSPSSG